MKGKSMRYLAFFGAAVACFVLSLALINIAEIPAVLLFLASPVLVVASVVSAVRQSIRNKKNRVAHAYHEEPAQTSVQLDPDNPKINDSHDSNEKKSEVVLPVDAPFFDVELPEDDEWCSVETVLTAPETKVPSCALLENGAFPFGLKPYPSITIIRRSSSTKESFSEQTRWYADKDALIEIERNISMLEFILQHHALALEKVPELKTDMGELAQFDDSSPLATNVPHLSITPLTRTGRQPKYPISVHFDTKRETPIEIGAKPNPHSSGNMYFLPDGRVGKAEIRYWRGEATYAAYFKLIDGVIDLNILEVHLIAGGYPTVLYRASEHRE